MINMTVLVHKGILVQWDTSPSGCGTDDITYDTGTLVLSPIMPSFGGKQRIVILLSRTFVTSLKSVPGCKDFHSIPEKQTI